jgi:DNA-binding transcriptional ArsR family regulator
MLQHDLSLVFHALSDPTRRVLIEQVLKGPSSVSELALPHAMSLAAIGQHIQLLETCGLVRSEKVGRTRTVHAVPATLQLAEDWFVKHRKSWERRFERLGQSLAEE